MTLEPVEILEASCICGHDHRTARSEPVDLCLDHPCKCDGFTPRCQNCGGEAVFPKISRYDACSRRCAAQLEYAEQLALGRAA